MMQLSDRISIKTVLAESQIQLRKLLTVMLKRRIRELYVAEKINDVLFYCLNHNVELLILDFSFLVENTLDLIKKIKETKPRLKLILTVSEADMPNLFPILNLGIDKIITKPLNRKDLMISIGKLTKSILLERKTNWQDLELQQTQAKYALFLKEAPFGIIVCNKQGKVIYANPMVMTFTHIANEKLLESTNVFEHPLSINSGLTSKLQECFKNGERIEFQQQLDFRFIQNSWYRFILNPIKINNKETDEVMILVEDISEYKQSKKRVEQQYAALQEQNRNLNKSYEEVYKLSSELKSAYSILLEKNQNLENTTVNLLESEKNMMALINATTDIAMLLDIDGKILTINESGVLRLKSSYDKLIGKNFFDLTPSDRIYFRMKKLDTIIKLKQLIKFTEQIRDYTYDITIYPILNQTGEVLRLAVFARDISENIENELKIGRTALQLQTIIDTVGEGITLSNLTGTFDIFNQKMEEITGYTLKEANELGSKFLQQLYPDYENFMKTIEEIEKLKETGENQNFETTIVDRFGKPRTLLVSTVLLSLHSQKFYLSVYRDITERKENEIRLEKALQQLETIFDTLPGYITIIDKNLSVVNMSKSMMKLYNFATQEDYKGKYCGDICGTFTKKCEICSVKNIVETGDGIVRYSTEEEEKRMGVASKIFLTPIKDSKGEVWGVVEFYLDISDLKNKENELQLAKMSAEEANSAKSKFVMNLTHEIRTPLNAILNFSDILKERYINDFRFQEYLQIIKTSAQNLMLLFNDILDVSVIETGKMTIQISQIDIYSILNELTNMLRLRVNEKSLQLNIDINKNMPRYIFTDQIRLRQILFNIAGNAVKFTLKGSISIKTYPVINEEDTHKFDLVFEISDTGVGIPQDKMKNLFALFNQSNESLTANFGGIGLGLYMTHQLVEKLGGQIFVSSKQGEGSTFKIIFYNVSFVEEHSNEKEIQDITEQHEEIDFADGIKIILEKNEHLQPEIVKQLEEVVFPIFDEAYHKQSFKILRHFGQEVLSLGHRFEIEAIVKFGEAIIQNALIFNTEKLMTLLKSFSKLRNQYTDATK